METIKRIRYLIIGEIGLLFDQRLTIVLLRKEVRILQRREKRPKLKMRDRLFFVILSCIWKNWSKNLNIVKPATVIRWHKMGFKLFWRFKSRAKRPGRPKTCREIRRLIRKMAKANPTWGEPRIHGELIRLGIEISESTVSNLMPKREKPPSPTWRAFIKNHMHNTCAMDFFTVPTATFKILFVLVILSHDRRKIVHFNVTAHPTALWTAQQIKEAFPWDTAPKYMIRDRDSIYGAVVKQQIKNMGIEQVVTAFKSPWQNGFVERVIGSIRRECTDHLIVRNQVHLKRVLSEYVHYYHNDSPRSGQGHPGKTAGSAQTFSKCENHRTAETRWASSPIRMARSRVTLTWLLYLPISRYYSNHRSNRLPASCTFWNHALFKSCPESRNSADEFLAKFMFTREHLI